MREDNRPTVVAEEHFWDASRWFLNGSARSSGYTANTAEFATLSGLRSLSEGLINLAVGVRATYALLEDVQRQLARHSRRSDHTSGP